MKTALFSILFHDIMTYIQKYDDVLYREKCSSDRYYNHTALQYKRLSSVMSRVGDSHPEKQGSKSSPGIFLSFFFSFFLMGPFLWDYCTTNLLYCDSEKMYGGLILVGPVQSY